MTLRLFLAALLFVLPLPAAADESADVSNSFENYKQALIAGDRNKVKQLTARSTHEFFAELTDRALTMREPELKALPLFDQVAVLLLRHGMSPEELKEMAKGDPIGDAAEERVFDAKKLSELQTGPFVVSGDRASAPLENLKEAPVPILVHFRKEEGLWRFDLMESIAPLRSLLNDPNSAFGQLAKGGGFAPLMIQLLTGRAPDANIWNPPG